MCSRCRAAASCCAGALTRLSASTAPTPPYRAPAGHRMGAGQAEGTGRQRRLGGGAPGCIEGAVKGHPGGAERPAQPIDHIADSDRHAAVAKAGEEVQQVPGGRLLLCRRPDPALRQHGAHAALPGPCGPQDDTDRLDDDDEVQQQAEVAHVIEVVLQLRQTAVDRVAVDVVELPPAGDAGLPKYGRAAVWERVCQYGENWV